MKDNKINFTEIFENIVRASDYVAQDAYQKGLNDAWECIRTLEDIASSWKWNDFYCSLSYHDFLNLYTASEAIEKVKAYEAKQKDENQIRIGDEVESNLGIKYIIYRFSPDKKTAYGLDLSDDRYPARQNVFTVSEAKKTGRHFDEMETLLEMLK